MDDNVKPWSILHPTEYLCKKNCYLIDGVKYNRVTHILNVINKPELMYWYGSVGNKKAREISQVSRDHGSVIHKILEWILNGKNVDLDNYDERIVKDVSIWLDWFHGMETVVEATELHLFSVKNYCAGTCDIICKREGKRWIGDWKTSKRIYDDYWLQLAAYTFMFHELTNIWVDGVFIVQIHNGELFEERRSLDDMKRLFPVFLSALHIFKYKNGEL